MLPLLFLCIFQDNPKMAMRLVPDIKVGEEYYAGTAGNPLDFKSDSRIGVCAIALFCDEYMKYSTANDDKGIQEMAQGKRLFGADHNSKIKILQVSKIPFKEVVIVEVRFLSGNQKDKKGWLFKQDIVEPFDAVKEQKEKADKEARIKEDRDKAEIAERQQKADRIKAEEEKKKQAKAEAQTKAAAKDEERAADLLKAAKRWLSEGDKELALRRVDELLKRFPASKAAPEAKKLKEQIAKK